MNSLTDVQKEFIKSKHVHHAILSVGEFTFDCSHGEWLVTKNEQHVDTFTFSRMSEEEFNQAVHDIFYDTEKVTLR